ncbi:permease prefix domain 1-containing protein [Deinococcus sp. VB142]|uniref:Permease prefix domain 1-containing protein n=1 Tax=Deinococcus sp. VB142 TaxID=3112952 RepID=A0AAU6Q3U1_9DEIO
MTAVTATPPALEQYLRRATAGLPPAKRQEVWDELEEHVYCRAEQLEWQGAAPEQALAQALAELGPPLRVSAGMNGVHNMPKILSIGGIAALIVTAGLYALAQQPLPTLRVPMQTQGPALKCVPFAAPQPKLNLMFKTPTRNCYQDDSMTRDGLYISFTQLKQALEPLGIDLRQTPENGSVSYFYRPLGGKKVSETFPVFKQGDEPYLDVGQIMLIAMSGFPVPVVAENYAAPTFKVGQQRALALTGQSEDFGRRVFDVLSRQVAMNLFDFSAQKRFGYAFQPFDSGSLRTVQTDLAAGEVVASYQWVSSVPEKVANDVEFTSNRINISVGVVDADGKVSLQMPRGGAVVSSVPSKPGDEVMLFRLTHTPFNNLKSGIFLPKL